MALNNKEEVRFWRELERVEQWLSTGAGAAAGRIYDTMGRPGEQTFANYGNELVASVARVERVRQALDQSGPMAKRLAMQQLSGIGLDDVWDILLAACKEIALYYGGAVVTGAVVGGAIGSLAFGAGAIPGAVVGGAAGSRGSAGISTRIGSTTSSGFSGSGRFRMSRSTASWADCRRRPTSQHSPNATS